MPWHYICARCGVTDAGGWIYRPPAAHTMSEFAADTLKLRRSSGIHAWVLGYSESNGVPNCKRKGAK